MHFLLMYDFVPDYVERRSQFRDVHLGMAWEANARGELVLAGAFSDPVDGAVLIFDAPSKDLVEEFARTDPYVLNGLVTSWRVRPWTTVVGPLAKTPVRPST